MEPKKPTAALAVPGEQPKAAAKPAGIALFGGKGKSAHK